jgi:transposase-like protein
MSPTSVRGACAARRGRGAGGESIVFGLLKRGDRAFTEIAPNVFRAALQAIIRNKPSGKSIVHTDGRRDSRS